MNRRHILKMGILATILSTVSITGFAAEASLDNHRTKLDKMLNSGEIHDYVIFEQPIADGTFRTAIQYNEGSGFIWLTSDS